MWGFNIGGIGKCFLMYDQLGQIDENLEIVTACINLKNIAFDLSPLHEINAEIIDIENRRDLSWLPKCHDLIKRVRPDLIFTHGFNGPVVVTALKWRYKLPLPFVCSYHGEYHAPSVSRKLVEPIFNKTMHHLFRHKADGVTCVCEHSKRFLIKCGIPPEKICTIHNGLQWSPVPEKQYSLRKKLDIADDSLIIGTASRIDPVKGLGFLLSAAASLLADGTECDIVLAGDGHSVKELKAQAEQLKIADRVHFVGFQDDMSPWLALFDIFALPSEAEYHSIGLLEAMRAQKAIVATDVGGNTESVRHEKEALIVPAADPDALYAALSRLIQSPDLRHTLAQAARQRFEEIFTEDITKKNLARWLLSFEKKS
jgi:glycosyltransferase involved in cell wall biosynthesis